MKGGLTRRVRGVGGMLENGIRSRPQRLKPVLILLTYGTTEVVPFPGCALTELQTSVQVLAA